MTRRIKKQLKQFFEDQSLTDKEENFILGCIDFQNSYPQLTNRQWKVILEIEARYKDDKSKGC